MITPLPRPRGGGRGVGALLPLPAAILLQIFLREESTKSNFVVSSRNLIRVRKQPTPSRREGAGGVGQKKHPQGSLGKQKSSAINMGLC